MTVPAWPATLPRPNREGYQHQAGDARRRTQPDAGPPRSSRKLSAVPDTVAMVFDLSTDQLGRLDRFFREDCRGGAKVFSMPNWPVHGLPLLSSTGEALLTSTGEPLVIAASWLCLFGDGLPSRVPLGHRWRASFQILVLP